MTDELEQTPANPPEEAHKKKRNYPKERKSPQQPIANIPNPAIMAMEAALPPLMDQRMVANQRVRAVQARANQIQMELEAAQGELAQIEGEVNYRLQTIAQMKGLPMPQTQFAPPQYGAPPRFADYPQQPPSPLYQPIAPYPSSPGPMPGVSSMPANNRGLHRDANPPSLNLSNDPEEIANGASAVDFMTPELRAAFEGRR